jgi:hypothetical protein
MLPALGIASEAFMIGVGTSRVGQDLVEKAASAAAGTR